MLKHRAAVHSKARKFKCAMCPMEFTQRAQCDTHMRDVHSKKNPKFYCEECGIPFSRKVELHSHYEELHPELLEAYRRYELALVEAEEAGAPARNVADDVMVGASSQSGAGGHVGGGQTRQEEGDGEGGGGGGGRGGQERAGASTDSVSAGAEGEGDDMYTVDEHGRVVEGGAIIGVQVTAERALVESAQEGQAQGHGRVEIRDLLGAGEEEDNEDRRGRRNEGSSAMHMDMMQGGSDRQRAQSDVEMGDVGRTGHK